MCYTYAAPMTEAELEERYQAELEQEVKPNPAYKVAAFSLPIIPIIVDSSGRKLQSAIWGLIPAWTKSMEQAAEIRIKTFNGRSETINEKASFKDSFSLKRCLIPATGFFEWKHVGKNREPYYIYLKDSPVFSFAGIYADWTDPVSRKQFRTASIITTAANSLMEEIHNTKKRMPAILTEQLEQYWIGKSFGEDALLKLLEPLPASLMDAHRVAKGLSSKSANVKNSSLIERIPDEPIQGTLF